MFNEKFLNDLLQSPEPHARRAAERVKYMWEIEGKFDDSPSAAAAPKPSSAEAAEAVLQAARDYLKQERSPDSRMAGDTFEVYIQTIKEQMRYDRTEFVVTPGLKVKLHFSNPDAMDHNLIMVQPGSATKVAFAAMKLEADGIGVGMQWIPDSEEIIFASGLMVHGETQIIEFTAPLAPGRYEYICTFPGHWQLMRGVMVVTAELEPAMLAANQPAVADPDTSDRKVVEYGEFDALKNEVNLAKSGRSYKTGKEMFAVRDLYPVSHLWRTGEVDRPRFDGHRREIFAAGRAQSHSGYILGSGDEYKTYVVATNGKEYFGTIIERDETTLTILDNPLTPEAARTIKKVDIEAMDTIDISPMPSDLPITLSENEIWDLLAYVLSGDDAAHAAFR